LNDALAASITSPRVIDSFPVDRLPRTEHATLHTNPAISASSHIHFGEIIGVSHHVFVGMQLENLQPIAAARATAANRPDIMLRLVGCLMHEPRHPGRPARSYSTGDRFRQDVCTACNKADRCRKPMQ